MVVHMGWWGTSQLLIHLGEPLVILFKALDLSFHSGFPVAPELKPTVGILERPLHFAVLLLHALVVVLLQLKISSHVLHLSIPVVELVPLHAINLLPRGNGFLHFGELLLVLFQVLFQKLNSVLQDLLVGVEC